MSESYYQTGEFVSFVVPDGFEVLMAGVTRQIRVNRDWLEGDSGPFVVVEKDDPLSKRTWYAEVTIAGHSHLIASEQAQVWICGEAKQQDRRSAWVETSAALIVKRSE